MPIVSILWSTWETSFEDAFVETQDQERSFARGFGAGGVLDHLGFIAAGVDVHH